MKQPKGHRENLACALWDLEDKIKTGWEFPDAAYKSAQSYKVLQSDLEAAYDSMLLYRQAA